VAYASPSSPLSHYACGNPHQTSSITSKTSTLCYICRPLFYFLLNIFCT
jgi:hypothetical protein